MTLYEKIKGLELLVDNGKNPVSLNQLKGQTRKIVEVKNGNIVYEHGVTPSRSYFNIDLLYKTYFIFQKMGELSVADLENIDVNYTQKGTPCNAVTFMLLMNLFFQCKITGNGKNGAPYVVKL